VLGRGPEATIVLARGDAEVASWPLAGSARPNLDVVDELARLHLMARRAGYTIRLRDACVELSGLLDLVGMPELATGVGLRQVGGQAECGEQLGVEEVVIPDDPVT
jgi:hypothetical protein